MQWQRAWVSPFADYLHDFAELIGDKRTWETLTETVKGIISAGSLVLQPHLQLAFLNNLCDNKPSML